MKYCVSGRQPKSILAQADEIKMAYKDRDRLIDYTEEFSEKTFILEIPKEETEIDWKILKVYAEKVNFMLALKNLSLVKECHSHGIKFYWDYPVFTWFELNSLIKLNPCYIILTAPLFFQMDKVKEMTNIPLRHSPNISFDAYIPHSIGIKGTWIRPEDTKIYEKYIDTFEFGVETLSEEVALLHVYKDNGYWMGNLNLLFKNFNINIDNRAVPEDLVERRLNCGQRCMEPGARCQACETAFKFAELIREKHYSNLKEST